MAASFFNFNIWRLLLLLLCLHCRSLLMASAAIRRFHWVLTPTNITVLGKTTEVVTVNGMFPGPTIRVRDGDLVTVNVVNRSKHKATIHWHGIHQLQNAWADGPEYVTQCPIESGNNFSYRFRVIEQQGTLWWHAHCSWLRATVHGAFIILPNKSKGYPYAHPRHEQIIIFGEWWNTDPVGVAQQFEGNGGGPYISDYLLINGHPSSSPANHIIKLPNAHKILLRIINANMAYVMLLSIANHTMTVVASDGLYTKPFNSDFIAIDAGQTLDVLLSAEKPPCGQSYYVSARAYWAAPNVPFNNQTITAFLHYTCAAADSPESPPATLTKLPSSNDTETAEAFFANLRSLNSASYPSKVPAGETDEDLFYMENTGVMPCKPNITCYGPKGLWLNSAMNNVSFELPRVAILEAYYFNVSGVFSDDFPDAPPENFDFTAMTTHVTYTAKATKVKVMKYNSTVQIVLQSTAMLGGENHAFHLHGHDFYVVGRGFGNYEPNTDPKKFNLVDPPRQNTVNIPFHGWAAIRFVANNPGAWMFHCHVEYHMSTGMGMVFITLDGPQHNAKLPPPPVDFPLCKASLIQKMTTEGGLSQW